MAQALVNAQHQVNLAALPSFSDNAKEDKYTAAQWLQKVLLHRQAAAWTDDQIITHVRNALKDHVIDWFDALPSYGVSQHVWAEIQARFEVDFRAKPTATSVVAKLPEVKQAADENINKYFNRANKILWELKSNIDPTLLPVPEIILPDAAAAAWEDIHVNTRNLIINHVRLHSVANALECYNVLIITAGLKPSIKAKILGSGLTRMAEIKDLALKTEQLEEERKSKSNGFPVNPVEEEDEVDALKYSNNRGNANKSYRGGHSSQYRGGRGGYQPSRGGYEPPRGGYTGASRGGSNQSQAATPTTQPQRGAYTGQRGNNKQNGEQSTSKWCANCKKPTHNTAQCWTKKKVNPVEEEQQQNQDQQNQNNEKDPDFADAIHSFYLTKN